MSLVNASTHRRAAVYLRISLDATGEGLAVDRQRQECERIIEQRGWTRTREFVDNSISASSSRKSRPAYDALLAAYDRGEFDALVCYDLDRLTRQPRQLEDWIDRAENRGLVLVTANGEADLSTDGGRMFARVKAAVARSEVDRKSRRQKDAARQRSALGRPPLGVRLTGYSPAGETIPQEAEIVRRIFTLFNAGESLRSITQKLDDEGVRTRHGRAWNPSTVRTVLTNPRYAGRAVYQGQETGQRGSWEALVSDDLFNLVQARLSDPRRITNRHGTDRKHLGGGLFLCGSCGSPVRSWSGNRYRCPDGCLTRSMGPIDEFVTRVIAELLRRPDLADLLEPVQEDTAPYLADVARLRERLDAIAADYDAGHIDGARFAVATERVRAELRSAGLRLATHTNGAALAQVLAERDPGDVFLAAPLMTRRAVIETLAEVRIHPGVRGSRAFDVESVDVRPRWTGSEARS